MYVDRMDLIAGIGAAEGLQAGIAKLGELRKGEPGYLGQTFLRSFAHPSKFMVVGRWENIEAAWAFSASQTLASFLKSSPMDPASVTRTRFDGYDTVLTVDADPLPPIETATCEIFVDWDVALGKSAEFEASRQELFDLRKKHSENFVSSRLRRSAGDPSKYLMIGIVKSRDAIEKDRAIPELQKFQASHPASTYSSSSPSIEVFSVLHRM